MIRNSTQIGLFLKEKKRIFWCVKLNRFSNKGKIQMLKWHHHNSLSHSLYLPPSLSFLVFPSLFPCVPSSARLSCYNGQQNMQFILHYISLAPSAGRGHFFFSFIVLAKVHGKFSLVHLNNVTSLLQTKCLCTPQIHMLKHSPVV